MGKQLRILAAAVSLVAAASLNAETFAKTYSATQCQDYELITDMLIGRGVTRRPNGLKIPQTSSVQVGVFSNMVAKVIPSFTNGVILSTGKITDGSSISNMSATCEWPDDALPDLGRDADLDRYFGEPLSNPAGIVLYIRPKNTTINIPFVMASEEFYYEYWDTPSVDLPTQKYYEQYSDKFAFFLKELADDTPDAYDDAGNVKDDDSPMEINIATLPDGTDVEIASVNQHTNTKYFISNVVSNEDGTLEFPAGDIQIPMEFNGAIVGPVAVAYGLDPNKIYKLKIIMGDGYDNTVNSVVFLRERGITSGADLKIDVTGPKTMVKPGTATFTDTVANIGPATADGVKVTHWLPFGVAADGVTIDTAGVGEVGAWQNVGGTNCCVWTIGDDFEPGSKVAMTVTYVIPPDGAFTNIATVATSTGDYDESNNTGKCVTAVGALPNLRIEAISTTKTYGEELTLENMQYVLSIDGTNETQVATGIDVTFTNAVGAVVDPVSAPVGTYGIVLSNIRGFDLTEFGAVTYVPGLLTVEKAAITVKANDAEKTYGEELTFAGTEFAVTAGSLASGDTLTSVTLACDGAAASAAWRAEGYAIVASDAQGEGLENYEITYADGKLTVAKRAITITARNLRKPYGEAFDFVGDEFLVTSGELVAGDSVDEVALASEGAAANAAYKAEGYPIVASDAQGTGLANYEITYVDGTLTVTKLALTVKANDAEKTYGEELTFAGTEFAVTAGSLASGDTLTSVTLTCDGAAASAAWKAEGYAIVASDAQGEGLENYEITYADGKLTMVKRAITVKANDAEKTYGEELTFAGTEFAVTAGSLASGDSLTSVTLTCDGAAANVAWRAEGYAIVASDAQGEGLENYEITYADGKLTMVKRAITVKANDAVKKYGETVTFAGTEFAITSGTMVGDDAVETVTLASEGAAATAVCKAEGYPIQASAAQGTGLEKYEITYVDGTLTVDRLPITIAAKDAAKMYGETLMFDGTEFTVTGELVGGDKVELVSISSEKAAAAGADVGEYENEIVPFHDVIGIDTNNYDIAFSNGTLTVTQAVLTISVNDATWHIKKPRPSYGFDDFSSQLKADDTIADVTGGAGRASDVEYTNRVWNLTVPAQGDEGEYADEIWIDLASLDGAKAANYVISVEPGLLTVDSALPELKVGVAGELNRNTGLIDLTLTIANVGDGETDADADYWVELVRGSEGVDMKTGTAVEHAYYLASPTGTMPDGYDYVNLTERVRALIKKTGNKNAVLDPGEEVTVKGVVSVYHWKRWDPSKFIDADRFFVAGKLFNRADENQDFKVSEEEKIAAASILGESSAEYLEVTRLALLPWYHWSTEAQTWK